MSPDSCPRIGSSFISALGEQKKRQHSGRSPCVQFLHASLAGEAFDAENGPKAFLPWRDILRAVNKPVPANRPLSQWRSTAAATRHGRYLPWRVQPPTPANRSAARISFPGREPDVASGRLAQIFKLPVFHSLPWPPFPLWPAGTLE